MKMKRYRLALGFLLFSAWVRAEVANLSCDPEQFLLASPHATYAYGEGYEKYEYSFDYRDNYWTAVVFHFSALPNNNPILSGVTAADSDESVLHKLFLNTTNSLMESSLANEVSDPSITETQPGRLLTFTAQSVAGQQNFGLLVQTAKGGDKIVYRTHHMSNDKVGKTPPENMVSEVLQAIEKSCSQDA